MAQKYKDDSDEVRKYAESQLKKQGRVDPAKRQALEDQSKKQESRDNKLTTMFRAGVGAITGQDSDEWKKLKKGLGGR